MTLNTNTPLAAVETVNGVRLVRGGAPMTGAPEFREMNKYESGDVDRLAEALGGPHEEPILNLIERFNPAERLASELLFQRADLRCHLRGRIVDLGAGACYFAAELSKLPEVTEVVALDMSERFLTTTGLRVFDHRAGDRTKLVLAPGVFESVPFATGYFDTACFLASIHHSLAPIKALMEACRVVRPGGRLLLLELIPAPIGIANAREVALRLTRSEGVTETAFTRSELSYWLRHAGWGDIHYHPLDVLTTHPIKRLVRRTLRVLQLENLVLANLYWIVATRPAETK